MGSTSHVNRYYWLRLIFFPFISLVCAIKYISCLGEERRIRKNRSNLSLNSRYEKLLGYYEKVLFMKNVQYAFTNEKKLLQNRVIFIVDKELDWPILILARELARRQNRAYSLLAFEPKSTKYFWKIVEALVDLNDVQRFQKAISSNRSLIISFPSLLSNPHLLKLIHDNLIPLVPIASVSSGKRVDFLIGENLKLSSLIKLNVSSFKEMMNQSFSRLTKKLQNPNG